MEAEFSLIVDDEPARPEDVFGSPREFIRGDLMHRVGHVVPPADRRRRLLRHRRHRGGDAGDRDRARLRRARGPLAVGGDPLRPRRARRLGARNGPPARLVGLQHALQRLLRAAAGAAADGAHGRRSCALLLTYILPAPVMLLATNRRPPASACGRAATASRSPPTSRPSPSLMIATGDADRRHRARGDDLAVVRPARARRGTAPASSRLPADAAHVAQGLAGALRLLSGEPVHVRSERPAADRDAGVQVFQRPIARVADPFSLRLIPAVLSGRSPSLLDLAERPAEYEDVGPAACQPFYTDVQEPSRFERIVMHALSGDKLRIEGSTTPRPACRAGRASSFAATMTGRNESCRWTSCCRIWRPGDISDT